MREYVAQGKSLLWNIFRNIFRMIFTIMQSVFFKILPMIILIVDQVS